MGYEESKKQHELEREYEKLYHSLTIDGDKQYFKETINKYDRIKFFGFIQYALDYMVGLSSLSSDSNDVLNERNMFHLKDLYSSIDLALKESDEIC